MAKEHLTTDFLITHAQDTGDLEVWVDWVPAVDGAPSLGVSVRRDGNDLLVEPCDPSDPDRRPRRLPNVGEDVLKDLEDVRTLIWKVCGPSGVLGEHRISFKS